jgi:tryptophanyl-tRNA synthetase
MNLQNPKIKMSKSAPKDDKGTIFILDDVSITKKKIMSACTDNEGKIYFDEENKSGISNLLSIVAAIDHIAKNDTQADVLTTLVEYYSSNLKYDNRSTKYNHVRNEFERILNEDKAAAELFKENFQKFYGELCDAFPQDYELSKEVMSRDIEWMKGELEAKK